MGVRVGEVREVRELTSDIAKFSVRTASYEVEFEGPAEAASSRYDAMISRLQSTSLAPLSVNTDGIEGDQASDRPKSKRGGIRSSVIAKALDSLIREEWFKTKRTEDSLLQELRNRRIPGVNNENLKVALNRRVRAGKVESIKDNGSWVFWSE